MASHSQWSNRPPHIQAAIKSVEDELDVTWPGWKEKKPFGQADYDLLARIKYLLKRHSLLTHEEGGIPAPRDWKVVIVRDGQNPSKCYAHPVPPDRPLTGDAGEPPPVFYTGGVVTDEPPPIEPPSATEIAFEHRLPLEVVEQALTMLPSPIPVGLDARDLVVKIATLLAGGAR